MTPNPGSRSRSRFGFGLCVDYGSKLRLSRLRCLILILLALARAPDSVYGGHKPPCKIVPTTLGTTTPRPLTPDFNKVFGNCGKPDVICEGISVNLGEDCFAEQNCVFAAMVEKDGDRFKTKTYANFLETTQHHHRTPCFQIHTYLNDFDVRYSRDKDVMIPENYKCRPPKIHYFLKPNPAEDKDEFEDEKITNITGQCNQYLRNIYDKAGDVDLRFIRKLEKRLVRPQYEARGGPVEGYKGCITPGFDDRRWLDLNPVGEKKFLWITIQGSVEEALCHGSSYDATCETRDEARRIGKIFKKVKNNANTDKNLRNHLLLVLGLVVAVGVGGGGGVNN